MTDEELLRLRAAANAATPGPWTSFNIPIASGIQYRRHQADVDLAWTRHIENGLIDS